MNAIDTYAVVKELKAVGFTEDQAEAVTRVVRSAQDVDVSDLATKADLKAEIAAVRADLKSEITAVRADLKSEIAAVRADLKSEIAAVRADMRQIELRLEAKIEAAKSEIIKWVFGAIGFQTLVMIGAVVALLKLGVH